MAQNLAEGVAKSASDGTTNGLSQLVARVLAQLSLSAWLPATALVLLTAIVKRMADVLHEHNAAVQSAAAAGDKPPRAPSLITWVVEAVDRLASLKPTDLILMFVAVVVLTMLTQAFAFEAIRMLEGYWSPWVIVELWAATCCFYFRQRLCLVRWREGRLIRDAWEAVEADLRRQLLDGTHEPGWSTAMVDQLRAELLLEGQQQTLTVVERNLIDAYRWREEAPPNLIRRLKNVEKRLADYPSARNVQPTRLGNVLRHFEEETGRESVESLVDEVFDQLPFSLQVSHDEQRGRLDLYCSMTFVWVTVVGIGALLIGWGASTPYTLAMAGTGLVAAVCTYRAAVASARHYGSLLLIISEHRPVSPVSQPRPWWRRVKWVGAQVGQ